MIKTVEQLAESALPKLLKCLIYQINDDSYVLFEEYSIKKTSESVILNRYRDDKVFSFNTLRNATAWAVLDKYNKFFEANRVKELDLKLQSVQVDKAIHKKLSRSKNLDERTIHSHKLQTDIEREKRFRNELDKYIIMANNCQQRGFQNELKRSERE